jgi:hypothetical protein
MGPMNKKTSQEQFQEQRIVVWFCLKVLKIGFESHN